MGQEGRGDTGSRLEPHKHELESHESVLKPTSALVSNPGDVGNLQKPGPLVTELNMNI